MYSRPQNRDIRIPHNYGGSIFSSEQSQSSTPVKDYTKRRYSPPHIVRYVEEMSENESPIQEQESTVREQFEEERQQEEWQQEERQQEEHECKEDCKEEHKEEKKSELQNSIFSPLGALGTEEILLIALALIIFQSGNDSELALILLALLFIN